MELSLLMEMHRSIDAYVEQEVFRNREIIIFGCNESAEKMMEYLKSKNLRVSRIVDNNPKKIGTSLCGVPVSQPNQYLLPKKSDCAILIASRYYPEMLFQLESMGYEEGKEVFKAAEYSSQHANSLTEQEFDERVQLVKQGERIYQDILAVIPGLQKLFICPPAALGDIYVAMSLLGEYLKENNIKSFAIVTKYPVCKKLAYLFGYEKDMVVLNPVDMDNLLQYSVFSKMANDRILVISHRFPYTCKVNEIGNYKSIRFADHFRYSIYRLDENIPMELPFKNRDNAEAKEYVEQLFQKECLIKKKTVILMPYANTAPRIDIKFWIEIASKLKQQGYIVCTNSSGDTEPVIDGTQHLFFDLRYGLEVVEAAGTMIALRCGLCDVLSSAKAKKIIIYPNRIYGPGSFMEFYSLNELGLCQDAQEFLWEDDIKRMVQTVIDAVQI